MSGMYPNNQTIEIFGEEIHWPGVDESGKFTNGSFTDPAVKPSFIPAQTINLILDNLNNLIAYLGLDPNNFDPEQLKKAFHNNRIIGELIYLDFEPTPLQLVKWRCLPVAGQIIEISQYQDLCNIKYCGDAANATADWWYKTSDPEGLIRDTAGSYMRVIDRRGVFVRPAGTNSKYKCADDTPYDGGSIGKHIGDAARPLYGNVIIRGATQPTMAIDADGVFIIFEDSSFYSVAPSNDIVPTSRISFNTDFLGSSYPRANENRPASISSFLCIKY
jgi:hypothetical protein